MAVKRKYSAQNTVANYKKFKSGTGGFKRTVPLKYRTGGFYSGLGRQDELKTADLAVASYACDTTGSITLLNGVATGTDFTDRVGRKTTMKSVYVCGLLESQDGTGGDNLTRVMIVYDSQPNGAIAVMTDILKTADSRDQINLNNRDRFQILYDTVQPLAEENISTATLTVAGSPSVGMIKKYIKLNHEVLYAGTTAAIASIQTGALLLVTVGNKGVNAGHKLTGSTRVRFTDV